MNVEQNKPPPGPPPTRAPTPVPKSPCAVQPSNELPASLDHAKACSGPWGSGGHDERPRERVAPSLGTYILPAQGGFAALAENVSYRVEPREQEALFSGSATHVDPVSGNTKDPAPVGSFCQFSPQTAQRSFHLESA